MQHLGLSARGYHRVLKVARTIADMNGEPRIGAKQLPKLSRYGRWIGARGQGR